MTAITRSDFVAEHYAATAAAFPLADYAHIVNRLRKRFDDLHAANATPCTGECNPGNCEVAHREHFGWDLVEAGAAFDRDMAR